MKKELKGRQVLGVNLIKAKQPYNADGKNAGQFFSNFALDGFVFSVNDNMKFKEDLNNGNIYSISVDESQIDDAEGGKRTVWSFLQYTTVKAEVIMAKAEGEINNALNVIDKQEFADADVNALKGD
jgi:hypothetical protein